jgi:exopolysaccharide biosynthesis polyprenyl glycosylphosphotransferase
MKNAAQPIARVFHTTAFRRDAVGQFPQVMSEALFHDAIIRQRRRADRFEEAFVLVLISLSREVRQSRWEQLVEALSNTKLDVDLIGWFKHGSVLGLVRSFVDCDGPEMTATLADALRRELARVVTSDTADGCSIRLEVYSPHCEVGATVLFDAEKTRRNRRTARDAAKRALDITGSLAFLFAFSPVFAAVAALVKLTSNGPVFFRQQRVGYAGRPFTMLKFRTMQMNADPRIHQQYVESFIHSNRQSESNDSVVFKIVNDPRVTPIGRFLRKSSLDEFPQFWNVLKGEMSLVGPRPPLTYEVARYKPWHHRRVLDAKPGITGLWQVTGRSRTTFDEMVRLDLRYAKCSSVWMDLKILLATPRAVLSGRGAH